MSRPPRHRRAAFFVGGHGLATLTLSGNEITDATRAAALQGDGRAADGSMGVWEATTNLCTNGGFETNTTGWTASSGLTLTRSTERSKFGSASLRCEVGVMPGTGMFVYNATLTAAQHFGSAWVYIPTAYDGGPLFLTFTNFTSPTAGGTSSPADMALRDQWQRLTCTITPAADLIGDMRLFYTGAAPSTGVVVYLDGAQIEARGGPTPYVHTNGTFATRSNASIEAPATALDTTQAWVAARVRPGWAYNAWAGQTDRYPRIMDYGVDGDNGFHLFYNTMTGSPDINKWAFKLEVLASHSEVFSPVSTHAAGDVLTVIGAMTAEEIMVSVDGAEFTRAARVMGIPDLSAVSTFLIGRKSWFNLNHLNGEFLWLACGTGTLTDEDAAAIHAFGNDDPPIQLLPGTPTFMWTADTATYTDEVPAFLPTEFEVPGSDRLLKNSYAILKVDCYLNGSLVEPSSYLAPTVVVTNQAGDTVASGTATITRTGIEYTLTPAQTAEAGHLTATWSSVILGTNPAASITTQYEIVGDLLFTLHEARQVKPLDQQTAYPTDRILAARDRIWDEFEEILGYSIGGRLSTAILGGTGETEAWLPYGARTIRTIETRSGSTWTAFTSDELEDALLGDAGHLVRDTLGYWPVGNRNIRITYESAPVPLDLRRAALLVLKQQLAGSEIDPRATQAVTDKGTFNLATPGQRGSWYGIPEVDVVLNRRKANLPGFA